MRKQDLLTALSSLLPPTGRFVNLVSDPAIYVHEWASFSTRERRGQIRAILELTIDNSQFKFEGSSKEEFRLG
jgi:hypothetical protein